MPNYVVANTKAHALLEEVKHSYFKHLEDAEVTIGLLFALAKEGQEGPVLKHHGYPALAVIKINSLRDRVEGKPDCTVQLDGEAWPAQTDARRKAILDHELTHLDLVKDAEGKVKTDDAGRPRLRLRLHDMEIGGFVDTVRRHKGEAVELQQYADLHRRLTQMELFPAE